MNIYSIKRIGDCFEILDQTLLPTQEKYVVVETYTQMIEAIKSLRVRGAPAIGIAAMAACYLACKEYAHTSTEAFRASMLEAIEQIEGSRPTAVNLFHSTRMVSGLVDDPSRMVSFLLDSPSVMVAALREQVSKLVDEVMENELRACEGMVRNGLEYIPKGITCFLTHCNTGSLATYGEGTALGVLNGIAEHRGIHIYVDETRPLLQGARLTMWELQKAGIPCTLITDNMVAHTIETRGVQAIITGADRIARNGDTANKVGTFGLAILARHFGIPFYIVAPETTIDNSIGSGADIMIEERASIEVTQIKGVAIAPEGVDVFNPAFDITPASLITAIITNERVWVP